jgi:putative membrane protein
MLRRLIIEWVGMALAFAVTAWLLSGVDVSGGIGAYVWVALLFGLVNGILGTIIRLITLPFIILTLGLLAVLINAAMLALTDALTSHLTIDSFWWTTIWAAIILAIAAVIIDSLLEAVLPGDRR